MGSKIPDDANLPYSNIRVRVQGTVLVAQPYYLKYCCGNCLLVDLQRGASGLLVFISAAMFPKLQSRNNHTKFINVRMLEILMSSPDRARRCLVVHEVRCSANDTVHISKLGIKEFRRRPTYNNVIHDDQLLQPELSFLSRTCAVLTHLSFVLG